jgi:uncharacterized protein (TIGR04255 family)
MSNDLNNDCIPEPHDLPNKPLGEAIFELRWPLTPRADGMAQHDPGFRILLGRYYDRLRDDYPHVENLQVSQLPEDMTPYIVHHQFRPAKGGWPLTQIGPGILTVNDTEGYTWGSFRPRISKALRALFESYPVDIQQLVPIRAQLTYINGLLFDATKESFTHFLRDYLHVTITIDQKLFEEPRRTDKLNSLDFTVSFTLDELPGLDFSVFPLERRTNSLPLFGKLLFEPPLT